MSSNTCKCWRCVGALQGRLWTVRDAIAALEEFFGDGITPGGQVELDGIMARLYFRERELANLIAEMEMEDAK